MLHWETWTGDHTCHTLQRRRRLISRRCQLAVTVEMFNVIQAHRRDLTRKDWLNVDELSDHEPDRQPSGLRRFTELRSCGLIL